MAFKTRESETTHYLHVVYFFKGFPHDLVGAHVTFTLPTS